MPPFPILILGRFPGRSDHFPRSIRILGRFPGRDSHFLRSILIMGRFPGRDGQLYPFFNLVIVALRGAAGDHLTYEAGEEEHYAKDHGHKGKVE